MTNELNITTLKSYIKNPGYWDYGTFVPISFEECEQLINIAETAKKYCDAKSKTYGLHSTFDDYNNMIELENKLYILTKDIVLEDVVVDE